MSVRFGIRPSRRLASVVAAVVCSACSLFIDLATDQCTSDSDCERLGPGLVCTSGTCVKRDVGLSSDAASEATPRCESNAKCIDDNFGEPYICEKTSGSCVAVKHGDSCAFVTPESELRNDSAVLFGAFIPLRNKAAPLAQPIALAYELALSEFKAVAGLPGGAGSPRRPLVAVLCDSDPVNVEEGVKHLTRTLHVPALVSLFSQDDMARFFQDYLLPTGTFTLNPQDTTEALKVIDADRLLWHLLGTPEDVALAYRPLIERVEQYAKNRTGLTTVKVAVVTSDSPTEKAISEIVRDSTSDKGIVFNGGKTCSANGSNFLSVPVPGLETNPTANFGDALAQLADFKPNIVVLLTANEAGRIIPALDNALATDGGTPNGLPLYVFAPRNARVYEVMSYIGDATVEPSDSKRKRFFGLQYAGAAEKTQYNRFMQRFADKNPTIDPGTYRAVENYYDAIYWLGYGLFAAGPGAPPKGSSFADGVRNLISGSVEITPGTPTDISMAFQTITNVSRATFMGALGRPDFNSASGAARSVGGVYCYVRDEKGALTPKYDVLRYDPTSKQLTGDFDCFLGF